MSLAVGTRLGPYEIQSAVGAGGMGEVYRARDTRLDRAVAIKVLPQHLSASADLRARFEREARAISSLQHPNICVLHDVGRDEPSGTDFLVMEFLEGETLAARLGRGPLPPEQAVRIGIEVADALDKAHRQGLVHRDLKPGNVMLTKASAKLMDFGLAKPSAVGAGVSASGAPLFTAAVTATSPATPLTASGSIVGTYQYMSPEQIEGREADARSDIFAFGAMLYEMLTGTRAFEGKSQLSVASAILEKDPEPVTTLQPLTPPALARVVSTCLQKDPDARFQTAHDLKLQLQWIAEAGSQAGEPAVLRTRRRLGTRLTWTLVAAGWLLAAAGGLGVWMWQQRAEGARRLLRAELVAPEGVQLASVTVGPVALSPDGTRLAFVASSNTGNDQLWVRDLAAGGTRSLEGTASASFPFWSPDGQHIGFFADGKLQRIPAAGGPVQTLVAAVDGRGAAWSSAGVIVYAPGIADPLYSIREGGSPPQQLTQLEGGTGGVRTHRNPIFLPDGKHYLYTVRNTLEPVGRVYAGSLDGMTPKLVLERGSNVQFADGYLLYLRDRNLVAQRFDSGALELRGDAIPLVQGVDYWNPRDLGNFSAAAGQLVYRTDPLVRRQFGWMKVGSTAVETFGEAGQYGSSIRVSPDGRKAAYVRLDNSGSSDVWLLDLERLTTARLTFDSAVGAVGASYAFSPDSSRIALAINTGGGRKITIRSAAGVTDVETVLESPDWLRVDDWSRDGKFLVGNIQRGKSGFDVFYVPLDGKREPVYFLAGPHYEGESRLSPNGRWLAYVSDESGRRELYVVSFPDGKRRLQVTSNGGGNAMWSSDGRVLYFSSEGKLQALDIRDPVNMEMGTVRVVPMPDVSAGEMMPGEKRALVLRSTGESTARPLELIVNWTRMLERAK